MYRVDVEVKGIRQLLQHRFPMPGEPAPTVTFRSGMPKAEQQMLLDFEQSKYLLEDGVTLYQPADHFHESMKEAAKNFKVPGKRGASYMKLAERTLMFDPEYIRHTIQECIPHTVPARVQRARIPRTRAMFPKWELGFQIIVREDQFPPEAVQKILAYAGDFIGVGDWRPKYGLFMVTKFAVMESEEE